MDLIDIGSLILCLEGCCEMATLLSHIPVRLMTRCSTSISEPFPEEKNFLVSRFLGMRLSSSPHYSLLNFRDECALVLEIEMADGITQGFPQERSGFTTFNKR